MTGGRTGWRWCPSACQDRAAATSPQPNCLPTCSPASAVTLYALVPEGKALFAGFSLSTLPGASLGYALAAYPKGDDGPRLVNQIERSSRMM